jgi:ribosomal protein S27AE
MSKQVKIKVDAAAFEYSSKKWAAITGIDPSKVTLRLSKGEGLPSREDAAIVAQLDQLLIAIENFKPMTLMGGKDGAYYHTQIAMWHKHLLSLKKKLKKQSKPQYLVDVVNGILKESKSKLRCSLLILTKCLHILGEQNLSPETIVSTIMGNESTDWEKLPVPLNLVKKTLMIHCPKTSDQQASEQDVDERSARKRLTLTEQVMMMYMFPYSCQTKVDNTELGNKIKNDLHVIEEYVKWARESAIFHLNDVYKAQFNSFRYRLQTLPQMNANKNTEKTHCTPTEVQRKNTPLEVALEKRKRMEVLTEDDQLAMLKERQCPRCGSTIEQAANLKGVAYLRCNTCKYYAGIENGQPYVNREHLDGVTPIRHDS